VSQTDASRPGAESHTKTAELLSEPECSPERHKALIITGV